MKGVASPKKIAEISKRPIEEIDSRDQWKRPIEETYYREKGPECMQRGVTSGDQWKRPMKETYERDLWKRHIIEKKDLNACEEAWPRPQFCQILQLLALWLLFSRQNVWGNGRCGETRVWWGKRVGLRNVLRLCLGGCWCWVRLCPQLVWMYPAPNVRVRDREMGKERGCVCVCACVFMCACVYVYMCGCLFVYVYVDYVHIYIYMCVHMYSYICI